MKYLLFFLPFAAPAAVLPNGLWHSGAYGALFEVTGAKVRWYDLLPGRSCVLNMETTPAKFPLRDWVNRPDGWAFEGGTLVVQGLMKQLPAECANAAKRDKDPKRNFEILDATFESFYAFFPQRGAAWQAGREKVRQALGGDWFPAACEWLGSLKDAHVELSDGKRECKVRAKVQEAEARKLALAHRDYLLSAGSALAGPAKPHGNRRIWTGRVKSDPSIGYLNIFTMGGFAEGETEETPVGQHVRTFLKILDETFAQDFKGIRALVVDLRFNLGGFDAIGQLLASRLTAQSSYTKQTYWNGNLSEPLAITAGSREAAFSGPVAVLIGPATVSAGETAALLLRGSPNVTLIGQATEGALSDKLEKKLPNGWTFSLSNEVYTSHDGKVFEAIGVPPQVVVDDLGSEAAILAAAKRLR